MAFLSESMLRLRLERELGPGGRMELMGRNEVAKECGSSASNVTTLVGLPAPIVTHLPNRPLWLASEVRAFARSRRARC